MNIGNQVKLSKNYLKNRCKSKGKLFDFTNAQRYHSSVGTIYKVDDDAAPGDYRDRNQGNGSLIWVRWPAGEQCWYHPSEITLSTP